MIPLDEGYLLDMSGPGIVYPSEAIIALIDETFRWRDQPSVKEQLEVLAKSEKYDTEDFAREFRTLRISGPRRLGHSHAALSIFLRYDNSVLICNSSELGMRALRDLESMTDTATYQSKFSQVWNKDQLAAKSHVNRPDLLIIDCASSFSNATIREIFTRFCSNPKTFFLFLE